MRSLRLQPSKLKGSLQTFNSVERISDWSQCRRRRYRLGRFWGNGQIACVIGLNPSTADDTTDDPTNRRLMSLLHDAGFSGYWLVNLIPESTPYPARLGSKSRRLSEKNASVIRAAADSAESIVLAWGAGAWRCPFRNTLIDLFDEPLCFGTTQAGEPKHPLYLPSKTALQRFPRG